jgi:DNA-binding protein YbaB
MLQGINKMTQAAGNFGQGAANTTKLMGQQQKLQKIVSEVRVKGKSKNGKVEATVNGENRLVELIIDPALIRFVYENFISQGKPDTMLNKAVMEAIEDAVSKVQQEVMNRLVSSNSFGDLMEIIQAAGSMGAGGGR